ncbi:MAG: type IX secretion system membrane protein PorP/SprF [Fulvivirga sp.]
MKKLLLPLLLFIASATQAQQDPLYAQYINNPMVLNPGYTGINNVLNASLSYRTQWTGFEGAPSTAALSAHSSFFDDLLGLGIVIVRDEVGSTTNTQVSATGAYKIELGEMDFSFGMSAGVFALNENNDELNISDPNDPLFAGNQSFSKFNIGAGAVLKSPKFYLGLSVPRLVNSVEELEMVESQLYQRHYYFGAGYFFNLGVDLALKPSILVKGVADAPASIDYNASVVLRDKYTAGLLTRNFQTYGLLLQVNFNHNLRIGYVGEIPTDNSVGSQFTSHEISITLDMEVFDFHFLDERQF